MIFTGNPKTPATENQPSGLGAARLTIRSDESAKRKLADTDGTARRARQLSEENRLL